MQRHETDAEVVTATAGPSSPEAEETFFPCAQCGADLAFCPGAQALRCSHCGAVNDPPATDALVEERAYLDALRDLEASAVHDERIVVHCRTCGANVSMADSITSDACAFCGSAVVATNRSARFIRPWGVLPFRVTKAQADESWRRWLRGLWFAPGHLRRNAVAHAMQGIYLPYWTYDTFVTTQYRGWRGVDYWVTQTYTTMVNGKPTVRTRRVRRTRWYPAAGVVKNDFDDVLVAASESLPRNALRAIEPWDLATVQPYSDAFLAGFRAESYRTDLEQGFEIAKVRMQDRIDASIRRAIGGDHQRISSRSSTYERITFKHILLPVWVAAYRYNDRVFRVIVNARTGRLTGERPWSGWKIAGAVAVVAAIVGIAILVLAR